jgi:hypothetical protein
LPPGSALQSAHASELEAVDDPDALKADALRPENRRVLLIADLLYGASIAAAGQRPMTPVYVITIPELRDPQLSRGGRHVLFLSGGRS